VTLLHLKPGAHHDLLEDLTIDRPNFTELQRCQSHHSR